MQASILLLQLGVQKCTPLLKCLAAVFRPNQGLSKRLIVYISDVENGSFSLIFVQSVKVVHKWRHVFFESLISIGQRKQFQVLFTPESTQIRRALTRWFKHRKLPAQLSVLSCAFWAQKYAKYQANPLHCWLLRSIGKLAVQRAVSTLLVIRTAVSNVPNNRKS